MSISKTYQPKEAEDKWYNYWLTHQFFKSVPDEREPYTIVIPPPNVTGVLHMGHMLNNAIQDVLIRRARMQGKNACWVPGTDHASIATEAKVVAMLKEKGITKKDISRPEFMAYAWEWREKYGGIILEQLKKLGASCDWDRTRFTMEDDMTDAVVDTFIDLYKKGRIYRGIRMVNWDPVGKTGVSDEEVIRKEVNQKLYYIRYAVKSGEAGKSGSQEDGKSGSQEVRKSGSQKYGKTGSPEDGKSGSPEDRKSGSQKDGKSGSPKDGKTGSQVSGKTNSLNGRDEVLPDFRTSGLSDFLTIATTRPETIMADAAICINPSDERYFHLHGKSAIIPLINKEIPIILDEYVSMDFGTGCLKVTPAHDLNDYELGQKHNLPVIDILNDDGTLNEKAQILVGEDRFAARKKIAVLLEAEGCLEKVEDYKSQIGFSERTDAVIEPKLSMQWFCNMDEMAKPALDAILKGDIKLIPEKYVNTYRYWMENIKDWCISRQLWWGQQIPAWYLPDGQFVIAKTREEAFQLATQLTTHNPQLTTHDLTQEEDVLDTWFSSWLWPISVFDGFKDPGNADISYYYPTNDLVTAPEILFLWVARMIMAGYEYRGDLPFKNVYLTGIVRDKLGRKMSKSLGNSPDPLGLIEKFGADGVRVGMLFCSPAGNDLMFDESYCEQGRNFANKVWNAFKLIKGWTVDDNLENPNKIAIEWFSSKFNQALTDVESDFAQYRLSEALMATYKLVWDDFCAWYLEMVKPAYQQPIDRETYRQTIAFFENILKLLHPFMPFISEELWHDELFGERAERDCCIIAQLPKIGEINTRLLSAMETVQQVITQIRNIRNSKNIPQKEALELSVKPAGFDYKFYENIILKLGNISHFNITGEKLIGANSFMVNTDEFYIPLSGNLDAVAEGLKLQKEKEYLDGFLKSVNSKLNNERFMSNAKPDVIEFELKKKADAEAKLKILEENLSALAG